MKTNKLTSILILSLTLSISAFADGPAATPTPTTEVTSKSPVDEIFKQNAIDLTNWVKATASETGKTVGPLLNKAGQTVGEQTPLFIADYIRWQIVDNLLMGIFGLTLAIISLYVLLHNIQAENKLKEKAWTDMHVNTFGVIIGAIMTFAMCGPVLFQFTLPRIELGVKALVAPRVVIVEKISELIKK